jgi:hypothetical protein
MQMLKKLFKSNDKFHLELDEIKDSEVVQTAVETASKAADAVKEKASEVASSQPVTEAVKATTDVAESAQDKLASALGTEKKPTEAKESTAKVKPKEDKKAPAKESTASKNGKATESTPETESTPDSTNTGASSYEPPFWVAAMYNTNNGAADNNGQVAEQTFATDNLMPTPTKFRRRPGGSLDKFKNMAKQAKTPKN